MLGVSYLISNILSYLPPVMMLSYSSCRICRKKRRCFSSHELSSWPPPFRWECQPGPSASTASVWATLGRTSIEDGIYIHIMYVHVYIYIHTYVCIYIYMYTCTYIICIYNYIYIYTHQKKWWLGDGLFAGFTTVWMKYEFIFEITWRPVKRNNATWYI